MTELTKAKLQIWTSKATIFAKRLQWWFSSRMLQHVILPSSLPAGHALKSFSAVLSFSGVFATGKQKQKVNMLLFARYCGRAMCQQCTLAGIELADCCVEVCCGKQDKYDWHQRLCKLARLLT